mmetsp:Transcript_4840/g.6231  ORF Transcript_4840/g.6231 Transcript_4840/m.6231 type:complete len:467 (+) Transcript_4840:57-1457(+)
MGGGVSKEELAKVESEKLTAQTELKTANEKLIATEKELKSTYANVAKIKAEKESKDEQLKTEVSKTSKVQQENEAKEKRINDLMKELEELKAKLAEEESKSVKRVLNVAANLLIPGIRNNENDENSSVLSEADSLEEDTKEAIAELIVASASSDPLYDNLISQIAELENKLKAEKYNTEHLGNELMLRASSPSPSSSPGQGATSGHLGMSTNNTTTALDKDDDMRSMDMMSEVSTIELTSPQQQMSTTLRSRDYSVLVDASSSMRLCEKEFYGRSRWSLAQEALEVLVPQVVSRDEDGITLYFFSSGYRKSTHVNSEDMVKYCFAQEQPKGGTELGLALADAVLPDNIGKAETILVITDGAPDNRKQCEHIIQAASAGLVNEDDLRIVFVQVGSDPTATRWLNQLKNPNHLNIKHNIVETITTHELLKTGIPFAQWVGKSVMPDLLTNLDNQKGNNNNTQRIKTMR